MRYSVIVAVASLFALSQSATASFIQPDTIATDGGTFAAGYEIGNLIGSGFTSPTDTLDAGSIAMNGGNGYASSNPPGAWPMTLTMEFNTEAELDTFYLWNAAWAGSAVAASRGFKDFNLKFYDAAAGGGSQIGTTFTGAAAQSQLSGAMAAQTFSLGETYAGVKSVELIISSQHNATLAWTGAHEVGFEAIPEPGTLGMIVVFGSGIFFLRNKLGI